MVDLFIFAFGLAVTVLIGSSLTTLIVLKNRALEAEEQANAAPTPGGAHQRG